MSTIPTCRFTGRIAGDPNACGDCDPCIMGASAVPDPVKKVIAERDKWADEYAGAMMEIDELRAALSAERERCARHVELIAADWREAGERSKVYASEYLARQIRELSDPGQAVGETK